MCDTAGMPEGDTIHRTVGRLRPALVGYSVASFEAARLAGPGPVAGTGIDQVEAVGKYVLIHFDDGTTLETHMKMSGSWHLYRVGERWRRSRSAARVVLETDGGWQAVCFSANHVKLTSGSARSGPGHLGPDLCVADPDLDEAVDRFALTDGETPSAVALLDQRICCGVGNVYKSEVLFACSVDPARPVRLLDLTVRRRLVETAHRMLRANLDSGPRTTVPEGLAVYDRRGQPCRRCRTPIAYGHHGVHARSTYWCPECQT